MYFFMFLCLQAVVLKGAFAALPAASIPSFTQTGFIPADTVAGNILANNLPYPATLPNAFANDIQVTPVITEIVPSLQYGDITLGGELPITGSIKVRGCFPVYGMVNVDGQVPSAGSAAVPALGNQVVDIACKCAQQFLI